MMGNNLQPSKRKPAQSKSENTQCWPRKQHSLATSAEIKERNVLVSWNFERNFSRCNRCERWRRSNFDDFTWFCENMADQDGIVWITAFLSDHKLKSFQEILNFLSKAERIGLFEAFFYFCLAKTSPLATAKTQIHKWIQSKKWA